MEEIWKDIKGFEGFYQVSSLGRVKSLDRVIERSNGKLQTLKGKVLKAKTYRNGYKFVALRAVSFGKEIMVHRLVAMSFIPNQNGYPCINHKDENKGNNRVDNLEWCTQKYNCNYGNHHEKLVASLKKSGYIKKVYQFTLDGVFVGEFESVKDATEKTGITNISSSIYGRISRAGNFLWSFSKKAPNYKYKKNSSHFVYLLDEKGNIIEQYKSFRSAARANNTNHQEISRLCKIPGSRWKLKYEEN